MLKFIELNSEYVLQEMLRHGMRDVGRVTSHRHIDV